MLKTIQIVAIVQGVFLLFVLFKQKNQYKEVNFWLLLGCIISILLFAIGDDDYNLFIDNANWFLFQEALIITFFFLFIRYHKSEKNKFDKKDFWFFVPYLISLLLKVLKKSYPVFGKTVFGIQIIDFVFFVFLGMLIYTIYDIIKKKKEKWLLVFIVPFTIIFFIDEFTYFLTKSNKSLFFLDSYGIILTTLFLLYLVLYKLITTPKEILSKSDSSKYKTSNLEREDIEKYKTELLNLMIEKKLFKKKNLTVNDVAKEINIPRQHLSEILNVHMKIRFQDLLNKYRVEEFIKYLSKEEYKNYTILAIATEVGFSSKSSFNTTFKKIKGITPSQYKRKLKL